MVIHVAVLNANTDRSAFAQSWPDDAQKVMTGLRAWRPDWQFEPWQVADGVLPDPDRGDAWIITGSVSSVNEEAPWMQALEDTVRWRHERLRKTVGLCFGHQLIAKALGGRVGPSPGGWRVGTAPTHWQISPPWMRPPCERMTLFAAHQEQVLVVPAAARVIGGDAFAPAAAMLIGEHMLTTQYHPELTAEFMLQLLDAFGHEWEPALVARAREEVSRPVDSALFLRWVAQFIEGPAPGPAA